MTGSITFSILCAARNMLLTTLFMEKKHLILHFEIAELIAACNNTNPAFHKLNKLKKTNPVAFYTTASGHWSYFELVTENSGVAFQ
jgi:hypothetical protein